VQNPGALNAEYAELRREFAEVDPEFVLCELLLFSAFKCFSRIAQGISGIGIEDG
jgi:hypothetical protein